MSHDRQPPYVRRKVFKDGKTKEVLSVGVVNSGRMTAPHVAVKLTGTKPEGLSAYWHAALQVMNEQAGVDKRDVHYGLEPLSFYEVVSHEFVGEGPSGPLYVRFASPPLFERELGSQGRYVLTLAIDGPNAEQFKDFVVELNASGRYEMREA